MDLRSHLAPPDFYLSIPKLGKVMQFTDVQNLNTIYSSEPNVQPLLGHTAPYVGEGSGNGLRWIIEAKLNPWHGWLTEPAPDSSARGNVDTTDWSTHEKMKRAGRGQAIVRRTEGPSHPYDELLEFEKYIQDFGPTPLVLLHRSGHDDLIVAITEFDSEIALQQSNPDEEERPSVIPVRLALIERREWKVKVF